MAKAQNIFTSNASSFDQDQSNLAMSLYRSTRMTGNYSIQANVEAAALGLISMLKYGDWKLTAETLKHMLPPGSQVDIPALSTSLGSAFYAFCLFGPPILFQEHFLNQAFSPFVRAIYVILTCANVKLIK